MKSFLYNFRAISIYVTHIKILIHINRDKDIPPKRPVAEFAVAETSRRRNGGLRMGVAETSDSGGVTHVRSVDGYAVNPRLVKVISPGAKIKISPDE